jgi:hypothetical protein
MDFLKVYIQFVNNYNVALETIARLKKMPEFSTWLQVNLEVQLIISARRLKASLSAIITTSNR